MGDDAIARLLACGLAAVIVAACSESHPIADTGSDDDAASIDDDAGPDSAAAPLDAEASRDVGHSLDAPLARRDAGLACSTRICGGGECVLAAEEDLGLAPLGNDTPSITLDAAGEPMVLVEDWSGGFVGRLMRHASTGWAATTLEGPVASGSLALGRPGPLVVATNDGAGHGRLWMEGPTGLAIAADVYQSFVSSSVWRDDVGVIHLLGTAEGTYRSPSHFWFDTTIHEVVLAPGDAHDTGGVITLGPGGVPWAAWTDDVDGAGMRQIRVWRGDTGAIESPSALRDGSLLAIAVRSEGGVAVPSIAITRSDAPIVISTQTGIGLWSDVIAYAGPLACSYQCDDLTDRVVLIAEDAALHVLFARSNVVTSPAPALVGDVLWIDADDPTRTQRVLTSDSVGYVGVRAVADACGHLHVAYRATSVDATGSSTTSFARYALLGAP